MIVPPFDGPNIILIDGEQFSQTRAFQTVHYRITLKKNSIFLHNFLQNAIQNYYFIFNSIL